VKEYSVKATIHFRLRENKLTILSTSSSRIKTMKNNYQQNPTGEISLFKDKRNPPQNHKAINT